MIFKDNKNIPFKLKLSNLNMYLSSFPEDIFLSKEPGYEEAIIEGLHLASKSKVHVMGLARDCEKALFYNIHRVERLCSMFAEYSVFVYENDSVDKTKRILNQWSKTFNISVECINSGKIRHSQDQSINRMTDMAYYRNELVKSIPDCDYVIMYDFDIIGGFSYDGVMSSLAYDLDIIGSNSLIQSPTSNKLQTDFVYYDTLALRHSELSTNEEKHLLAFKDTVVQRGAYPIEVESCFGGLSVYKPKIFTECKYENWDCEHVTFNAQARHKGYKVWLNPSQIVLYNPTRFCQI